jgi:S-adenosylmethionine hydrolase
MKGVILGINPRATVIDITHEVPPQAVRHAAFILAEACPYFPPGTVHAAVVDPGMGSERRAVAVQTPMAIFVGPDNGLFSYLLANQQTNRLVAVHLTNPYYWRAEVSSTFHGRDIFAPVAAHLSLGVAIDELGELMPASSLVMLPHLRPEVRPDGSIIGHVLRADRFGNLITDIAAEQLCGALTIEVAGRRIAGLKPTYAAAERGELVALIGSTDTLEIAVREGNAAQELRTRAGAEVIVRRVR